MAAGKNGLKPSGSVLSVGARVMKAFGVFFLALSMVVLTRPGWTLEFSADVIQIEGGQEIRGKFYIKGNLARMEMEKSDGPLLTITRLDQDTVWFLNSEDKTFLEIRSVSEESIPENEEALEKIAVKKVLGRETLNGYVCDKIEYVFHDPSQGRVVQWVAEKLNYPIKIHYQGPDGEMITEYRNIKEQDVPDFLFEIPSGYKKLDPSGLQGWVRE